MTCPKCGLEPQADQKFCRSCGASLRMTTQPLSKPNTRAEPETSGIINFKDDAPPANRSMLVGFIIMFLGVVLGVVGKRLIYNDAITVVGILVSLVGMFLTIYPYLAPPRRREHHSTPSTQTEELTQSQPAKTLPPEGAREYVPSITERTTDLLKNTASPRAKQNEGGESHL